MIESNASKAATETAEEQAAQAQPFGAGVSYLGHKSRIRVSDLKEAKLRQERWAMLTCYDTISARIFDKANITCLLVGDSAAQMVYGYKSTIPVTMDEMIPLARAVASSCERALVIADLPFGSYQESPEVALRNATRFMKESQVHGVKLEGGKEYVNHVRLLAQSGIPVMAHIGFTPQSEHALGGFKVQGRGQAAANQLVVDAIALQDAGAFACVLELMPREVGGLLTRELSIPTIGIGAGPECDAQVLVWQDMAGFSAPRDSGKQTSGQYLGACASNSAAKSPSDATSSTSNGVARRALDLNRVPKFVKKYANMSEILYGAALEFAKDVASGDYPAQEHCYQ